MIVHEKSTPTLDGSVVAIGAFDGMHLGHQAVISEAIDKSRCHNVPSIVYTFDPPPRAYFQHSIILTDVARKVEILSEMGIDQTIIASFDRSYVHRSAEDFLHELTKLHPKEILVGNDFRFGRGRSGNVQLLKQHFNVRTVDPVRCPKGKVISSTRIRRLINVGEIKEASNLLG